MAEPAKKYEYIHPGASKNYDYSWDVLQMQMIFLWRGMPKSMNTSIHDHLKTMTILIAETCFSFQRLPSCGACLKYECIHPGLSENYDYSWDVPRFPMIILWRSMRKSMNHLDHLKTMITAETCFNFQWLSYGGACWKVWIHPSRTI